MKSVYSQKDTFGISENLSPQNYSNELSKKGTGYINEFFF